MVASAEPRSKRAVWRALAPIRSPERLGQLGARLLRTYHQVEGRRRQLEARAKGSVRGGLARQILELDPPWSGSATKKHDVPAMIQPEEADYYVWLGGHYTGRGEVVEIGPWLGASTVHILDGLAPNPEFGDRRLNVYDDFVWRSVWMDPGLPDVGRRPDNGESFQPLFEEYTAEYATRMEVRRCRLATEPANASLPEFGWDGRPIEFAFIDTGRHMEINQVWWERLEPAFIPGVTLLVLQDWQTDKIVPRQWFNQMWHFTTSKGERLDLVHELRQGGVATFLYLGAEGAGLEA